MTQEEVTCARPQTAEKMANGSVSDEWMYNDVLDDELVEVGIHMDDKK